LIFTSQTRSNSLYQLSIWYWACQDNSSVNLNLTSVTVNLPTLAGNRTALVQAIYFTEITCECKVTKYLLPSIFNAKFCIHFLECWFCRKFVMRLVKWRKGHETSKQNYHRTFRMSNWVRLSCTCLRCKSLSRWWWWPKLHVCYSRGIYCSNKNCNQAKHIANCGTYSEDGNVKVSSRSL
jgi:hypothetical protein